ncbi:MAG TPA: hypothetical protein VEC12_15185, partial [Bacteroidia bacterium]|nr:hypothetical protein [Bacteroidia bacterium]
ADENDFSITWNGTAAGTITLPASTSGTDRVGRLYFFKNTSAVYTLTLDANSSELIDNLQTVVLQPGESTLLVKTNDNTASGSTYEVLQITKTQVRYEYVVSSNITQTRSAGALVKADFNTIEYSTNGGADFNLTTDIWTCPQAGWYRVEFSETGYITTSDDMTHVSLSIFKNGGIASNNYYNLGNSPVTVNLRNSGNDSKVLYLVQGDQIHAQVQSCTGCGVASYVSTERRLVITRL